jgi:TPR repeat protein
MYENGRGVIAEDDKKAVELYQRACDGGEATGCSYFGWGLIQGVGVSSDRERGIALLRNGCSQGDTWGCDTLRGLGAPK